MIQSRKRDETKTPQVSRIPRRSAAKYNNVQFKIGLNSHGMAVDGSGNVWVSHYGSEGILPLTEFTGSGTFIKEYGEWGNATEEQIELPYGVAVSPGNGNLYIGNYQSGAATGNVKELTTEGQYVRSFVGEHPVAVTVDQSGDVWEINSKGTHKIEESGLKRLTSFRTEKAQASSRSAGNRGMERRRVRDRRDTQPCRGVHHDWDVRHGFGKKAALEENSPARRVWRRSDVETLYVVDTGRSRAVSPPPGMPDAVRQ
jgi:hypothetical protein